MQVRVLRDCFVTGRYYGKNTIDEVPDDWVATYPKNFVSNEGVPSVKPVEEKTTYKSIAAAQTNFTSDIGKPIGPTAKPTPAAPQQEMESVDVEVSDEEMPLNEKSLDWDNAEPYVSDKPEKPKGKKKGKAK